MDEIKTTLSDPVWWVTVVAAGIAINLVVAWIIRRWDSFFSKLSKRYKSYSDRQREDREIAITELKTNPQSLYLESLAEVNLRLHSQSMLMLSVLSLLLLEWLSVYTGLHNAWISMGVLVYAASAFFYGFLLFRRAQRLEILITESRKTEDQIEVQNA